ncbi:hypothetical protein [Streptomyces sioyaensis]
MGRFRGECESLSSGSLTETGASDHGKLAALGLIAGAVFTFTPWGRLRR